MKYTQYELLTNLRGFAAILVVFSHASNAGLYLFPGLDFSGSGRYGVYLFFILSAFLLTSQLDFLLTKKRNFKRLFVVYLSNRFTRIYPLFIVMLLVYLIVYLVFGAPNYINGVMDFIKHVALLKGDGIFWTIPVEFKFYFILPFVVLMKVVLQPVIFYLLIIISIALFSLLSPVYDGSLYPFLGVFLLGNLFYYQQKNNITNGFVSFYFVLSVAAFFLIIPAGYRYVFGVEVARGYFHPYVLLHCAIFFPWIYLCANKNKLAKAFNFKFLEKAGQHSFSLYLIHPLTLLFVNNYLGESLSSSVKFSIFFIITIILSYISWVYIEVRLRHTKLIRNISYSLVKSISMLVFYLLGRVQKYVFK
ncbi:MAG: peptidoglycan/LPS O-acetylase OafA/YrhL [Cycloclasticus pugetii]|uniref:acyltransferase family protein n=1 Tax=Cycloclasticus pugetii TaxID=34068 RepID=UPI00079AB8A5|nr:MAG: hypothetical protein AXW17_06255 [Colwellia sp. Phe_37]